MRISELSRRSGVPVSTIKFYIRDGLLPVGEHSHRNQATYGAAHLERLDLIKALREVAGLSLEVVREVLEQTGKPWGEGDPIGAALQVIYRIPERDRTAAEREQHARLEAQIGERIRGLDWVLDEAGGFPHYLNVESLADSISQIRKYLDPEFPVERLDGLAAAAWKISEVLYEGDAPVPQPGDDLVDPTRSAVLGTLLLEPLVTALVRSALAMRAMHLQAGLTPPPA